MVRQKKTWFQIEPPLALQVITNEIDEFFLQLNQNVALKKECFRTLGLKRNPAIPCKLVFSRIRLVLENFPKVHKVYAWDWFSKETSAMQSQLVSSRIRLIFVD
jgi:hypothetical protein